MVKMKQFNDDLNMWYVVDDNGLYLNKSFQCDKEATKAAFEKHIQTLEFRKNKIIKIFETL